MRIAIIGAGNVGGTLGRRWATVGHDVVFGLREPAKGASAVKGGGALPSHATIAAPGDAARDADVIVLATPWSAVAAAVREMGPIDGKVLIDATNPLGAGMKLDVGPNGASGGERVQALAPGARVVKAFNTTGFDNMRDPHYDGVPTVMLYAGDDSDAKRIVRGLVGALGFEPVDAGTLVMARELEHFAVLWISLAHGANGAEELGRGFAYRIVRR